MTPQKRAAVTRKLSPLEIPEAFAMATLASAAREVGKTEKSKRALRRLGAKVAKLQARGEL